jgi:hypothetical protein
MVKDYVEIGNHASLDELIARLTKLRDELPAAAEAELRMKGDDIFGRRLSIAFMRPLTAEEAECEGRYRGGLEDGLERAA